MKYIIPFIIGVLIAGGVGYVYIRKNGSIQALQTQVVALQAELKEEKTRLTPLPPKEEKPGEAHPEWKIIEGNGFTIQIPPGYDVEGAAGSLYVVGGGQAVMRISTDGRTFNIEPQGSGQWQYYSEVVKTIRFTL